jgi:hypothetical protein
MMARLTPHRRPECRRTYGDGSSPGVLIGDRRL